MTRTRKRTNPGRIVRSDSRGRIQLGPTAVDKDFRVEFGEDGTISLVPVVFIPEREAWLYKNEEAMKQIRDGLADAAAGRVVRGESFAEYADLEIY